jgi:GT2 family glycosyltransferase
VQPQTDIICLVHNQLPITKVFVEKIFKYTENFSLIFVNNNSTDGTAKWLEEGSDRWTVIHATDINGNRSNLGVIGGRNLGVKYISSKFFVNLDNDQYVGYNWLELLHATMEKGYDIVGKEAWQLVPPGKGGVVMINGKERNRDYFPFHQCKIPNEKFTYIGCGGMLIKTEVYNKIGLFDEQFSPAYYEDPDLTFRAIKAGFKIGWCPQCPIKHLAHQTIGKQKDFNKNEQFLRSWDRFRKKWNGWFPE